MRDDVRPWLVILEKRATCFLLTNNATDAVDKETI